jgi:hypothetical protein
MNILKEEDGTLRCPDSLELLGHWFLIDNVTYIIWIITNIYGKVGQSKTS